jgi:hypothetical protein
VSIFGRIRTGPGKGSRRRSPSPEKEIETEDRIGDIQPSIIIRIRCIKAAGRTPGEEEIADDSGGGEAARLRIPEARQSSSWPESGVPIQTIQARARALSFKGSIPHLKKAQHKSFSLRGCRPAIVAECP